MPPDSIHMVQKLVVRIFSMLNLLHVVNNPYGWLTFKGPVTKNSDPLKMVPPPPPPPPDPYIMKDWTPQNLYFKAMLKYVTL